MKDLQQCFFHLEGAFNGILMGGYFTLTGIKRVEADLKRLGGIVMPYALAWIAMSFYCYWNYVGINPFEFIALDAALTGFAFILLFVACALVPVWIIEALFPSKERLSTTYAKRTITIRFASITALVLNLGALAFALAPESKNYLLVFAGTNAALVSTAAMLMRSNALAGQFTSRLFANATILVLCMLPTTTLWAAATRANSILGLKDYQYVEASALKELDGHSPTEQFAYYGRLGDYLFFKMADAIVGYETSAFKYIKFNHQVAPSKRAVTAE